MCRTVRANIILPRFVVAYSRDASAIICPVVIVPQGYPPPVVLADRFRIELRDVDYAQATLELLVLPVISRAKRSATVLTGRPGELRQCVYDKSIVAYASTSPGDALLAWRRAAYSPHTYQPEKVRRLADALVDANVHGFIQAAMTSTYHGSYRDAKP